MPLSLLATPVPKPVAQPTQAAPIPANTAKPNPFDEPAAPDPLLPSNPRPLTPFEQRRLREALADLDQQAQQQLAAKNGAAAFEIWYRLLRLQPYLTLEEEVNALGRIGGIAWDNSRSEDVNFIGQRLRKIQQEQAKNLTPPLLEEFATAYQKIHDLDRSLVIQQRILANARQSQNAIAQDKTLNRIGELYLAKFDYPNAAAVYETLLDRAQAKGDSYSEGIYLQNLAEIYNKALQPENAVAIKERLVARSLKNRQPQAIAPLKISIAQDYETLKQPEKASQNYQEAFSLAWSLQQLGAAAEALQNLGKLYQTHEQADYALQIYGELLKVEQRSYNYYGLMRAYDQIGQIYLKKQAYPQALTAFQQAFTLAQSINYRVDYYQKQIAEVNLKLKSAKP
jgi:tetratricopeptide (TPR) repeat protein